jgi:hypothetical protein
VSFAGFPARAQATAIPHAFFSDILPELAGDAVATGVALYAFSALHRKKGSPRYITAADLRAEAGLATYLDGCGADAEYIESGLARICATSMLLRLSVESAGERRELYFLNAPADRRGMESVRRGEAGLGRVAEPEPAPAKPSGIFPLYESLIGGVTPLIADELAEAERLYPSGWLEAAFREAAAQNARSWRYVSRILERWAIEGRDDAKAERDPAGDSRYFRGKYGRILRQRLGP